VAGLVASTNDNLLPGREGIQYLVFRAYRGLVVIKEVLETTLNKLNTNDKD
jgi:hypothetical protein